MGWSGAFDVSLDPRVHALHVGLARTVYLDRI